MRNWSIGRRLALGQASVALCILLTVSVSVASVHLLTASVSTLYDATQDELQAIEETADSLAENRIAEAYLIDAGGKGEGGLLKARHAAVAEQLAALDRLMRDDPLRPDLRAVKATWQAYLGAQAKLVANARAGRIPEAKRDFAGEVQRRFEAADNAADRLIERIDARAELREQHAEALGWWSSLLVIVLGALTLVLSVAISLVGRNRIGKPISRITASLTQLAAGDLSVEVAGAERRDEIGAMVRSLEVFRENAHALEIAHNETREAQAHAEALARHDALTGLPNRRLFVETLGRLYEGDKAPAALLMIDLDRFKPVNDVHGHAAGDMLLCTLAERLKAVSAGATVARLGGDEFAVLLPLQEGAEDAVRLCETILHRVAQPFPIAETSVEIGATVGISLFPQDGRDASSLLRAADLAMYEAKNAGRGCFRFFEAEMQAEVERRAAFEADLQRAIARDEIRPHYQPLVSIDGSRLVGFEVLARWEHPDKGIIMPDAFIPVAEERGLLGDLTSRLLRRACLDARAWPRYVRLSVNMSPSQLRDPLLPVRMLAILRETGTPPQRIEVEVTENALVSDLEATKSVLASLQNLGMTVALDDFGTGYSSLYHLRELRFDKIKVDKSFVRALDSGDEKMKIVQAMIGLGKSLGLTTTAEGIEEAGQWQRLQRWGCDFGQGYLFGRAMPADDAADFAARHDQPALLRASA